ncbi:MAG TPA: hypothetical protein VMG33_03105 [Steroidobacteraceae bacterium]|nr:hypothetical protein [Steroidobacteraceae bacterium]
MKKPIDYRAALVVAASLAGASMLSSSARVYANERPEYRWSAREDAAYRRYLADQRQEFRDSGSLGRAQRAYWG